MNYKSHMIVSVGAAAAAAHTVGPQFNITGAPAVATLCFMSLLGGFIPDIDHAQSKFGRALPSLSWLIRVFFEHRGFTHSLIFLAGVFYGMEYVVRYAYPFIDPLYHPIAHAVPYGLTLGALSHVFADACTRAGVRVLFPLPFVFRFPILSSFRMRTGSPFETLMALALVAVFFVPYIGRSGALW